MRGVLLFYAMATSHVDGNCTDAQCTDIIARHHDGCENAWVATVCQLSCNLCPSPTSSPSPPSPPTPAPCSVLSYGLDCAGGYPCDCLLHIQGGYHNTNQKLAQWTAYRELTCTDSFTALPRTAFVGLEQLHSLTLTGTRMTSIEYHAFLPLGSLRKMTISGSFITELWNWTFVGLKALLHLSLVGNTLMSIGNGTFAPMQHLQTLNMNFNSINKLEPGVFGGISASLTLLNIGHNVILYVLPGTWDGLNASMNTCHYYLNQQNQTQCQGLTSHLMGDTQCWTESGRFVCKCGNQSGSGRMLEQTDSLGIRQAHLGPALVGGSNGSCVCPAGQYFNTPDWRCEDCSTGQYQPLPGMYQCEQCDSYYTPEPGANSSELCQPSPVALAEQAQQQQRSEQLAARHTIILVCTWFACAFVLVLGLLALRRR